MEVSSANPSNLPDQRPPLVDENIQQVDLVSGCEAGDAMEVSSANPSNLPDQRPPLVDENIQQVDLVSGCEAGDAMEVSSVDPSNRPLDLSGHRALFTGSASSPPSTTEVGVNRELDVGIASTEDETETAIQEVEIVSDILFN
jgi:hypothetical protein